MLVQREIKHLLLHCIHRELVIGQHDVEPCLFVGQYLFGAESGETIRVVFWQMALLTMSLGKQRPSFFDNHFGFDLCSVTIQFRLQPLCRSHGFPNRGDQI